ncbi:EamA family transporter RarD [Alphaproteobacteria bacterium]|nr:EamA family transporter RarD [Alphaproteobacteria bacterium]
MKIKPFHRGVLYTCLASLFWGIPQPLFFNEIKFIPAFEVAIHRGLWSFIFLLFVIFFLGKFHEFLAIFKSTKKILFLSFSALLISTNWTGFILAVSINRVQDASMGYYLTPMISIALGYLFLNEKISPLKFLSVIIMLGSLVFLFISLNTLPFLAILIGITWGVYGLLRKQVDVSSEVGLLYESLVISLIGIPYLIFLNYHNINYFFNHSSSITFFLILTGVVTIFPLFFFNLGVKNIPLGLAGIIFYLAPTFHFITSVFILKESISFPKMISFIAIWIAILIFIFDVIIEEKKINESNIQ